MEEKLKQARLRSAKRRMQIGTGLFASICLCSLLIAGPSLYDFFKKENVPVVVSPQAKLPESGMEEFRDQFKKLLQYYETDLEPRLDPANLEVWNPDAFFKVEGLKKKVMSDFANGDYTTAMDNLLLLKNFATEVIKETNHLFEENIEKSASFLAEDLYAEAAFHIQKALIVKPQSPEALRLRKKIEKLPEILPLLSGANVARTENDLQGEYDFLQQIIVIAPEREALHLRMNAVAEGIKTQKFNGHISSGFADIEKKQVKDARYHYQEARKIDNTRTELSVLSGLLLELERSLRVQQAVSLAEQAVRRDDWQQVRQHLARAAKDEPENKSVAEGLSRADHVIELLARFSRYFQNPYRLAHAGVRNEAQETLVEAEKASGYSFSIKRQSQQLGELITKVNRLIPVTVISDGKTYVLVRSVGKVGLVSQKTIQLKPGSYTFEGTRRGFKSELVQSFITYDQNLFSVRVICDEPI